MAARIIINTMDRKSCRAFFSPYTSHSPPLLRSNHPSFSRGDLPFLDLVEFGTPYSWVSGRCGKKVATFCGTCASIVFVLPLV